MEGIGSQNVGQIVVCFLIKKEEKEEQERKGKGKKETLNDDSKVDTVERRQ